MRRSLLWLGSASLFIGMLLIGWMFRERNSSPIDLELVWIRFPSVEIWWVILVAMGLGAGLTTMTLGFASIRSRLLNVRYRRVIKRLESELHEMRSLPLAGHEFEPREPHNPIRSKPPTIARQA